MRVVMVLLALGGCAAASRASGGEMVAFESSLRSLKSDLRSEKIKKVRVLFVPYHLLTIVALTPEHLQATAEINQVVEMDRRSRESLLDALEKTKASPLNSPPDLRWGAIFYDTNGQAVHSVYLNGKLLFQTGKRGIIDGNLVQLNGVLFEWFESTFGKIAGIEK